MNWKVPSPAGAAERGIARLRRVDRGRRRAGNGDGGGGRRRRRGVPAQRHDRLDGENSHVSLVSKQARLSDIKDPF